MRILCPTCGGKGSIPDPKCLGIPMGYVGPNGEVCPYVFCQTCSGGGWVNEECGCKHEKGHVSAAPPPAWPVSPSIVPPAQSSISIYETSMRVTV